jgi:single-strand DNA-binding protein
MRVIVQGQLRQRSYEDKEGVKRTVYEIDVTEVGPSLLRATAVVTKVAGKGGQSGYGQQGQGQGQPAAQQAPRSQGQGRADDPWSQSQGGAWGNGAAAPADEPPF